MRLAVPVLGIFVAAGWCCCCGGGGDLVEQVRTAMEEQGVNVPSATEAVPGMPSVTTYTSASAGFKCNATVTSGTAANDTWVARFASSAGANKGTCSLTFSNVTMGGAGYAVEGTLSITADTEGGASSGMVMLSGTF